MTALDSATQHRLALLLRDASTIAARYHIALTHADQCRAGWPTTTIGAAPDTTPSSSGGNGIPHDSADRAINDMRALLRTVTQPLEQLARLVDTWTPEAWWTHHHTPTDQKLAEIDGGLWCPNHLRHGHHETRDHTNRRVLCRWCDGIKRDTGHVPDHDLIERRARLGRTTTADISSFVLRNGGKKRKKKSA